MNPPRLATAAAAATALLLMVGCGDTDSTSSAATGSTPSASEETPAGVRRVAPDEGAAVLAAPPEGLIVLDVRTPEEFAEGHVKGATILDFYRDDFADQLSELDRDVPYVVYCRSGNRSGQATALMEQLGFTDVVDIDGGILAWTEAGLPTVGG